MDSLFYLCPTKDISLFSSTSATLSNKAPVGGNVPYFRLRTTGGELEGYNGYIYSRSKKDVYRVEDCERIVAIDGLQDYCLREDSVYANGSGCYTIKDNVVICKLYSSRTFVKSQCTETERWGWVPNNKFINLNAIVDGKMVVNDRVPEALRSEYVNNREDGYISADILDIGNTYLRRSDCIIHLSGDYDPIPKDANLRNNSSSICDLYKISTNEITFGTFSEFTESDEGGSLKVSQLVAESSVAVIKLKYTRFPVAMKYGGYFYSSQEQVEAFNLETTGVKFWYHKKNFYSSCFSRSSNHELVRFNGDYDLGMNSLLQLSNSYLSNNSNDYNALQEKCRILEAGGFEKSLINKLIAMFFSEFRNYPSGFRSYDTYVDRIKSIEDIINNDNVKRQLAHYYRGKTMAYFGKTIGNLSIDEIYELVNEYKNEIIISMVYLYVTNNVDSFESFFPEILKIIKDETDIPLHDMTANDSKFIRNMTYYSEISGLLGWYCKNVYGAFNNRPLYRSELGIGSYGNGMTFVNIFKKFWVEYEKLIKTKAE